MMQPADYPLSLARIFRPPRFLMLATATALAAMPFGGSHEPNKMAELVIIAIISISEVTRII
jgi:hypothetical protein